MQTLFSWNRKSSSKDGVWFVGKRCSLHTPTMNYSDAEPAESIDARAAVTKGRFSFFLWRAQTSLSSAPVSTPSPPQINTFAALVEAGHTLLPTLMSQRQRKFTTNEERRKHSSNLSGNKAGVVPPHEIFFFGGQSNTNAYLCALFCIQTGSTGFWVAPAALTWQSIRQPLCICSFNHQPALQTSGWKL